jgi:hypothetical protein
LIAAGPIMAALGGTAARAAGGGVVELCASSSAKRELCKSWEKGKAYS